MPWASASQTVALDTAQAAFIQHRQSALAQERSQLLDERLAFRPNNVSTLGMLTLVPRSK